MNFSPLTLESTSLSFCFLHFPWINMKSQLRQLSQLSGSFWLFSSSSSVWTMSEFGAAVAFLIKLARLVSAFGGGGGGNWKRTWMASEQNWVGTTRDSSRKKASKGILLGSLISFALLLQLLLLLLLQVCWNRFSPFFSLQSLLWSLSAYFARAFSFILSFFFFWLIITTFRREDYH